MKCNQMNDTELRRTNALKAHFKFDLEELWQQSVHECLAENTNNQNVKRLSHQIRKAASYNNGNDPLQVYLY